jgi:hypothetical protein
MGNLLFVPVVNNIMLSLLFIQLKLKKWISLNTSLQRIGTTK